jgi:hypothetical protein
MAARLAATEGRTQVIFRYLFRMLWVVTACCIAAGAALAVLLALGGAWVGDELKAAAPHDPMLQHGAPVFGIVLFAKTVTPALTVLPALVAVVIGEVLRLRSWIYYVLAGGAALAVVPLLAAPQGADLAEIAASHYMTIFATAGFAGGFIYWLLAGARA